MPKRKVGKVFLVGAGPGDAGLITRRGLSLLKKADCLLFDRLASPDLLASTGPRCEKIDVGKPADGLGGSQAKINRLLVQKARQHSLVVRLKGGDPTLFGRISEECEALVKAGVPFEIVPGVSSAWAAAAAAGIPLTDRRYSSSVAFVTGQSAAGSPKVRWEKLAKGVDTLVILMGRKNLPRIIARLLDGGKRAATPIALIRWASTPRQEILTGTLKNIEEKLKAHPHFGPPVVAVIGEVVRRHHAFKPQPLNGKKILVTRPAGDGSLFLAKLKSLGATPVHLPTIEIKRRKLSKEEREALLKKLPAYDWIIFTSHHGVEALRDLADPPQRVLSRLIRAKVCAIGPRTACAASAAGLSVTLKPEFFSTDGIARAFADVPLTGKRLLIPRSNLAVGDKLSEMLRKKEGAVDEVILYETAGAAIPPRKLKKALRGLDAVTFTSASTVDGFLKALDEARIPVAKALNGALVAAIGPETARALRPLRKEIRIPKKSFTIEGLTETLVEAYRL